MGRLLTNTLTALAMFSALMTVSTGARAVESDLYLAGLGLHQETGRNIYLGGIYLEREAPRPDDLTAAGTRIMEYRVVARRTSIRSLLGGMLLQSEVATGFPPAAATARFVDDILSKVNTSLKAGDSFQIRLYDGGETVAMLNGHELARINDAEVADYLLMGWVGESGPSTVFRNNITSGEVDPSLLSALEANTYSAQREAEIAGLVGAGRAVAVTTEAAASPAQAEVATAAPAGAADMPSLELVEVAATPMAITEFAERADVAEPAPAAEDLSGGQVQLAALVPGPDMMPGNALEAEIRALGIQEYSRRLSTFHGGLVSKVYGEIRYPKRAVRRNLEGRVELDVTLTAAGELLDVTVGEGSGHKLLDDAASEAARKAFKDSVDNVDPVAIAEFGDFSAGQMTIPIPVSFRLQ